MKFISAKISFPVIYILFLFFMSCGSSDDGSGRKTLRFAHAITGGASKDVIEWVIEEYEAQNPDVKVNEIAMSDDVYEDLGLISLFQSNRPPDVYYQWGGWLVERDARDGRAADLTDVVQENGWGSQLLQSAWDGTDYNERTYMIPTMVHATTLLWYNQDIFEQLGLSQPLDWNEFIATCERAKKAGIVPITLGNKELWPLGNWAAHILSRTIGEEEYERLFQQQEGTSFTDPGVVEALAHVYDLAQNKYFLDGMIALEDEEGQAYFRTKRALYHPIGNWVIPIWVKEVTDLRFDCFNTPPIQEGLGDQSSVLGLISGYMIYKNTPLFDESVAFLKMMMSVEAQQRFVQVGQYSTLQQAFEGDVDPHLKRVMEILSQTRTIVPPPDTGFNVSVADAFYSAVQAVAGGRSKPEQALEEAQREALRHKR